MKSGTFAPPGQHSASLFHRAGISDGTLRWAEVASSTFGYYPVRALTGLFGPTPHVKDSRAWTREDVNRRIESTLQFDNGVTGKIMSSLWSRQLLSMQLSIQGEAGQMQVTRPYHPQLGSRIKVKGIEGHRTERTTRKSTYTYQLEAFRDSIRQRTGVATDCAAAVLQRQTLDAIYGAAGLEPRP